MAAVDVPEAAVARACVELLLEKSEASGRKLAPKHSVLCE